MKNIFYIVLLLNLFSLLNSCTSTRFAQKAYQKAIQQAPYDAIIVPGLPYDDSSNLNIVLSARMLWSKALYDRGITKNIIYSGAAVATPYIEGIAMKCIADSMGIPSNHTFAETRAEHSTENIWYGYLLAQKLGFKRIALATDPFQIKMTKGFIRKRMNNMPYIPIIFIELDPAKTKMLSIPKIDPSSAYVQNFVPLAKREGFFKRFSGTRGKHIDFSKTTY